MGIFDFIGNMIGLATEPGRTSAANQQQWNMANQQYENQKEFAQSAITWRVMDAQRAGVHPLFALGASGASYTPPAMNFSEDRSGEYLSKMGQSADRAIASMQEKPDKVLTAFELERQAQQLEGGKLDLELKRMELASRAARLSPGQVGPGMPRLNSRGSGQPALDPVLGTSESKPNEIPTMRPAEGQGAGPAIPGMQWMRYPDDTLVPVPGPKIPGMDEFEAENPQAWEWFGVNRVTPYWNEHVAGQPNSWRPSYADLSEAAKRAGHNDWRLGGHGRWESYYNPGPEPERWYERYERKRNEFVRRAAKAFGRSQYEAR